MRSPIGSIALATALTILISASPSLAQGQIVVISTDAPGTGFFDPTPAAPVGGNPGTTLGEQRQNVFLLASAIWTQKLQPTSDIFVLANFCAARAQRARFGRDDLHLQRLPGRRVRRDLVPLGAG
jgi:hypothetical protein